MIDNFFDTLFVSDTHLSTKGCNDQDLRRLLSDFFAPKIHLIGDIIDLWKLKTIKSWPEEHTQVISDFVQLLQDKPEVKYIIGNHDEYFKNFAGPFSNLTLTEETTTKIGNKELLVIHGHQFDSKIKYFKLFGIIGSGIHDLFRKNKESIFSLSAYLEKYPERISKFEKVILGHVKKRNLDGVICGHTHKPNLVMRDDLLYANTGDFVRNSTFITSQGNKLSLMAYENGQAITVKEMEV